MRINLLHIAQCQDRSCIWNFLGILIFFFWKNCWVSIGGHSEGMHIVYNTQGEIGKGRVCLDLRQLENYAIRFSFTYISSPTFCVYHHFTSNSSPALKVYFIFNSNSQNEFWEKKKTPKLNRLIFLEEIKLSESCLLPKHDIQFYRGFLLNI